MNIEVNLAQVTEHVAANEKAQEPTPRDYEAEARASGWVPEAEFKGDKRPAAFLDAETFVHKGEEIAAFTRKDNKALKKRIDELERTVDTRVAKLANVQRANYERDVQTYEREITRLKGEQYKAVEAGDTDAFKALDKEIGKVPVPEQVEAEAGGDPVDKEAIKTAAVAAFKKANSWYETDDAMTAYAEGYSQKLAADAGDKLDIKANLKLVETHMRKLFPDAYKTAAKPNGHPAVDDGGNFVGNAGNPLFSLPNEARSQCKSDMEKYPKIYKTAADWIAVYNKK